MGCGASTEGDSSAKKKYSAANGSNTAVKDEHLPEDERNQVRRIRSNYASRRQVTLSTDPESLDHYKQTTFKISEEDPYYQKPEEIVTKRSGEGDDDPPPNLRRKSSIMKKRESNSDLDVLGDNNGDVKSKNDDDMDSGGQPGNLGRRRVSFRHIGDADNGSE